MHTPTLQHTHTCVLHIPEFNLEQTLNCGQSFRWQRKTDGSFIGVANAYPAHIHQQGDTVSIVSIADETFWRHYFDIETDYCALKRLFFETEQLVTPCKYAGGIRILRQDGWETLASFIISQNNNIKRISGIIARLCENFGAPVGEGLYAFPTAEKLAACTVEDLAPLRSGFRARYIIDAAQRVCDGTVQLDALGTLPLDEARMMLMQIVGVGRKVADCALLFGFYRLECFPVDVWIDRALKELFADGFPETLTPYAGIAQQMLFHYMRMRPKQEKADI
ncbi:MAG: DNA-3-methyladenine glycosylase family protein [Candidatus Fimivivens sp.]